MEIVGSIIWIAKMSSWVLLGLFVIMLAAILYIRCRLNKKRGSIKRVQYRDSNTLLLSFFHPFCNDMGGGEKVLFKMLQNILNNQKALAEAIKRNIQIAIYSAALASPFEILSRVKSHFNISISEDQVTFVKLRKGDYLKSENYPAFTLVRQAFWSAFVIFEALWNFPSDILIDTTGFGWIYPIAKLFCPNLEVVSYSHYPFVSEDMVAKVENRTADFNNKTTIAASGWKTKLKSMYYRFIIFLYKKVGKYADLIMVNSTWTYNHFASLWSTKLKVLKKLYPPCTVKKYMEIPLSLPRKSRIVSLGQFRPEKNQKMQIEMLKKVVERDEKYRTVTLAIVGSCRSSEDEARMEELEDYARSLGVEKNVIFKKNLPYNELFEEMKQSMIGIHTTKDEHFGIAVVEMLAAGLVTIAHNSAGPKYDIICEAAETKKGYLGLTVDDFVKCVCEILDSYEGDRIQKLRKDARDHAQTFSDESFDTEFMKILLPFLEEKHSTAKSKLA